MLMTLPSTTDLLNRLLVLHERSLPMYLGYAPPDRLFKHERARAVLMQIVEDQKRTIDRLGGLILESHGTVDHGEFPMAFTSLHDLSLSYLLNLLIERQQKFVTVCDRLADQLTTAPFAQAAAREAVGEAKGHLENLQDLQRDLESH